MNKRIFQKTAVMIACWMYHFEIVSALVQAGATVSESHEWVKKGVIFYRKMAYEKNVWTMSLDDSGYSIVNTKSNTGKDISLKEKMNYLNAEENEKMSRIENFFAHGSECPEINPRLKLDVPEDGGKLKSGPRSSVNRRSINRQGLNLDVSFINTLSKTDQETFGSWRSKCS